MSFNPLKVRKLGTVAECISRLFKQAGGIKRVMVRLDCSQASAYAYSDGSTPITFTDIAALTDPNCPAAAEFLCELAGGFYMPFGKIDSTMDALSATADQARKNGEAVAAMLDALKDQVITRAEAEHAEPLIQDSIRSLATLLGCVQQVLKKKT